MADVTITRADREAALLCVGSYVSPKFRPWIETGDADGFAVGSWPFAVAIPTALAIATARAEGWAAGVEEAAKLLEARADLFASEIESTSQSTAETRAIARLVRGEAVAIRALAAREGER